MNDAIPETGWSILCGRRWPPLSLTLQGFCPGRTTGFLSSPTYGSFSLCRNQLRPLPDGAWSFSRMCSFFSPPFGEIASLQIPLILSGVSFYLMITSVPRRLFPRPSGERLSLLLMSPLRRSGSVAESAHAPAVSPADFFSSITPFSFFEQSPCGPRSFLPTSPLRKASASLSHRLR